jgi:putative tricarboxylic transport membrane protein
MEEEAHTAADLWSGLALAALGIYITVEAWQWENMGPDGPGPGFFPLWCGISMVVLSVVLVISSGRRKAGGALSGAARRGIGRALGTWLALVVSASLFKLLGFALAFALFTFFLVLVMYRRPVRTAAAVAIASALAFYLVFPLALGVPVPVGVLGI